MADEKKQEITQKKTLRLKKTPSGDKSKSDAPEQASSAPVTPVPAVVGRSRPAPAAGQSSTGSAIVALIAALIFATLVLMQVMELQTYKYAFPRTQLQAVP